MNTPQYWITLIKPGADVKELVKYGLDTYQALYNRLPTHIRLSKRLVKDAVKHIPEGIELLGNGGTLIGEIDLPQLEELRS